MIQKVILPTKVCNANFRYFTGTGLMILYYLIEIQGLGGAEVD